MLVKTLTGSRVCVTALLLCAISGCGGGGGPNDSATPVTDAKGSIILNVSLAEPAGVTDFSGVLVSVSGASSTTTETTLSDGKLTFAGLKITDTKNGTTYSISATKTDYQSASQSVVLVKDGESQTRSMSLQFSAGKLSTQAWSVFSTATKPEEFLSALNSFEEAVNRAVTAQEISESNNGYAWTCFLGFAATDPSTCSYQTAKDSFQKAINANGNPDAKVGQAFALVDNAGQFTGSTVLGDLNTAIGNGEQVLTSNPTYSFANATQFNYVDVRATLAYAYAQKYLSTASATDQSSACTQAKAVKSVAVAGTPEYQTADAADMTVGGCP